MSKLCLCLDCCEQCYVEHAITAVLQGGGCISFGSISRTGIAGSCGSSIFNFGGIIQTVFHKKLHQSTCSASRVQEFLSLHILPCRLSLVFLMMTLLTDVQGYLVFLMAGDAERLFMCTLAFFISCLEKCCVCY